MTLHSNCLSHRKYKEMNLDGIFGLRALEGQLLNLLEGNIPTGGRLLPNGQKRDRWARMKILKVNFSIHWRGIFHQYSTVQYSTVQYSTVQYNGQKRDMWARMTILGSRRCWKERLLFPFIFIRVKKLLERASAISVDALPFLHASAPEYVQEFIPVLDR